MSGLLLRNKQHNHHDGSGHGQLVAQPEPLIRRSESLRPAMKGLDLDGGEIRESKWVGSGLAQWMSAFPYSFGEIVGHDNRKSDLTLLLGVMGAPLAPLHVSISDPLPHLIKFWKKPTPWAFSSLYTIDVLRGTELAIT